jgi:excisionase family DNA binding protein
MATVNYETPVCGRMLNVGEVGRALGKSPKTIRNLIYQGRMKWFKIGGSVRVAESEVLQILARSHRLEGGKDARVQLIRGLA